MYLGFFFPIVSQQASKEERTNGSRERATTGRESVCLPYQDQDQDRDQLEY